MWRLVLAVALLCGGSDGSVTCRNNNNGEVDWYILYKAPALPTQTGLEYLYMDSTGSTAMKPSTPNYKSISDPNGVLANTLRPLFTPIRSMPDNFGFISYSDQPPGCQAAATFGHSKGVVMVEKSGTGVWLSHSTPQFPFRRDPNHFWPDSGTKNAQTFICATFSYNDFNIIGNHLQYIGAFPFEHDVPADFPQELRDAVNWAQSRPPNNFQTLTSVRNTKFKSFAKQQSEQPKVGDLYVSIAQLLASDLDVQTWGCQRDRKPSYCVAGIPKVLNIKRIKTGVGEWDPKHDHSKWCVTKKESSLWTCVADVNRATTQYARRGGALCIENQHIKTSFLQFAGATEDCSSQTIMDLMDTDCDPDPDPHTGPSLMG